MPSTRRPATSQIRGPALPPRSSGYFLKFPIFQNVLAPPNVLHIWLYSFIEQEYRMEKKIQRSWIHRDSQVLPQCSFQSTLKELPGPVQDTNILSFELTFWVSIQLIFIECPVRTRHSQYPPARLGLYRVLKRWRFTSAHRALWISGLCPEQGTIASYWYTQV